MSGFYKLAVNFKNGCAGIDPALVFSDLAAVIFSFFGLIF